MLQEEQQQKQKVRTVNTEGCRPPWLRSVGRGHGEGLPGESSLSTSRPRHHPRDVSCHSQHRAVLPAGDIWQCLEILSLLGMREKVCYKYLLDRDQECC